MIKNTGKIIALVLLVNMLGACSILTGANTHDNFLTKPQIGMPGATIAEVDGIGSKDETIAVRKEAINSHSIGGQKYRTQEVISELYIAPYLDKNKILHESRIIRFILSESKWITG
jgi:hypothetical protein